MFHQISCVKNKPIKVYSALNLCDAFFLLAAMALKQGLNLIKLGVPCRFVILSVM